MTLASVTVKIGPKGTGGDAGNTNSKMIRLNPGAVRFVAIDYHSSGNAEMDVVLKRDSASGTTIFTRSNSQTDLAATAVGTTAIDEGQDVTASTDAMSGGLPYTKGIYVSIAQMDNASYAYVTIWYDEMQKRVINLLTNGSGDATAKAHIPGSGVIRFIQVDFSATAGAGTTMVVKDGVGGPTLFTKGSAETDFGPSAVGAPAKDEAMNAAAATDGLSGGLAFKDDLVTTIASGGASKVTQVSFWYDGVK